MNDITRTSKDVSELIGSLETADPSDTPALCRDLMREAAYELEKLTAPEPPPASKKLSADELLDELAGLARHWASNREANYTPVHIRTAMLGVISEIQSAHEPEVVIVRETDDGPCECGNPARGTCNSGNCEYVAAFHAARASQPPLPDPNEGPIVNGLVQIPDGVLPPFNNRWTCSQCGRDPQDVRFNGCGYSQSCGRVATLTKRGDVVGWKCKHGSLHVSSIAVALCGCERPASGEPDGR